MYQFPMLNYISQNPFSCIAPLKVGKESSWRWLEGWKSSNNYFVSCTYLHCYGSSVYWHEIAGGPRTVTSFLAPPFIVSNSCHVLVLSSVVKDPTFCRALLPSSSEVTRKGMHFSSFSCSSGLYLWVPDRFWSLPFYIHSTSIFPSYLPSLRT